MLFVTDDKESFPANSYVHSLNSHCTNVYPPTTDRAADIYIYIYIYIYIRAAMTTTF